VRWKVSAPRSIGLHQHLRGELTIGLTDNLVTLPHMRITHALAQLKERGPDVQIQIRDDRAQ